MKRNISTASSAQNPRKFVRTENPYDLPRPATTMKTSARLADKLCEQIENAEKPNTVTIQSSTSGPDPYHTITDLPYKKV